MEQLKYILDYNGGEKEDSDGDAGGDIGAGGGW